jgi:hypothetical protein
MPVYRADLPELKFFRPLETNHTYKRKWEDVSSSYVVISSEVLYPFSSPVFFRLQIQKGKSDQGKYPSGLQIAVLGQEKLQEKEVVEVNLIREERKGRFFFEMEADYRFLAVFPSERKNFWVVYKIELP